MKLISKTKLNSVEHTQSILTSKENVIKFSDDEIIKSPFRYPGSKAKALKFIKPIWEKISHDEYREPLVGGGAIFFSKPKVKYCWINDLDYDLYITYKVFQNTKQIKKLIPKIIIDKANKKRHLEIKNSVAKNELDITYRYYYLNRTSYSGIMKKPAWGYHEKRSVHPDKWGKRITEANKKLENVKITNLDFEEIINAPAIGKSVFMFVDPPYYEADQKRAYMHSFTEDEHVRLSKVLKKTRHKFCLTYDNCEPVKELYNWAKIQEVSWRYDTANSNVASRKMGRELIITNF